MNRFLVFVPVLLGAVGCGSVVVEETSSSAASGAGGATAGTGSGDATTNVSSAATSGSQGSGGTGPGPSSSATSGVTTTTGVGGGPSCYETHDGLSVTLAMPDGQAFGCYAGVGQVDFTAAVVSGDATAFVLDTCSPAADCVSTLAKLSVSAPDLYLYLPVGSFVRVRVNVAQDWGCSQVIQIDNVPSWGGLTNPFTTEDVMWLAAADGAPITLDKDRFGIQTIALGCYPNGPTGCGTHDDYVLSFFDAKNPSSSTILAMGQIGYFGTSPPYWPWQAKNLRSYESGACDDSLNWAYWVTAQLLDGDGAPSGSP